MLKQYTCIICPNGCDIKAEIEYGKILTLEGATCPKGKDYVEQEMINPQRNIASSVLVEDGDLPLLSVRLSAMIPKGNIFEVIAEIKKGKVQAPVKIGQVIIKNVLGLGCNVIATKNIHKSSGQF